MSMSLSMSSSRLSGGGGLSLGGGLGGARLGMGMGGGTGGLGLGLGGGGGLALGLGLGGGFGGGAGGGAGFGMGGGGGGLLLGGGGGGFGLGGGGGGLALGGGGGGGGGGMLMASPAFTMGRTMAAGGIGGGSALAAAALAVPSLAPMQTRAAEKHTLSTLNDRFSAYMTKVRSLQQENTALEAKLSQLTGGTDMSPEASSTTVEFEAQLGEYRGMLEALTLDTIKLEIELDNVRGTAHEIKAKYDFEQGVKFQLEADIGAMKRDIEMASDLRIEMDAKFSSLKDELDFVTKTQEEELSALQAKLGTTTAETSVSMIEVDTDKSFDIANALNKLRVDYEKTVQQHRAEAEAYYKLKMDEMQTATVQSSEAISSTKVEILATKKELLVLGLELQGLVTANMSLEHSLAEAHAQSSVGLAEAQAQIVSLTSAIEVAKSDLHKQILAYQELLDIKLALDVEISTYRKLLEGDDFKLPEFTETSFTFTAGGGGIQVKEIITEETETSVISDAEST